MFVVEEYQYGALTKVYLVLVIVNCQWGHADNFTDINLPEEHMPYYFNSYHNIAEKCKLDPACPYKVSCDVTKLTLFLDK
jgi:protein O-GlcNAc transferase